MFGQDAEGLLADAIQNAIDDVNSYITPLVERLRNYGNSFGEEVPTLRGEMEDLHNLLGNLSVDLSNGGSIDVTACLNTAHDTVDTFFDERSKYR